MNMKEQFDQVSKDYDKQRRLLIPCFDELYQLPLTVMDYKGDVPNILDIGGGTGLFTEFVMNKYPNAEYTLIDLSDKMLEIAKQRFINKDHVHYVVADYTDYEYNNTYDIIISSLSIHHLPEKHKRKLYTKLYTLLNKNGIFINADQMLSPFEEIEKQYITLWHKDIENSGLPKEEVQKTLKRMEMDDPSTLNDQIEWLKEAGFKSVDCLYKYRNFCTIYARK